ncbi:MAG: ATP-binding protein [Prolixibacteraceae bacterium]|nr:ATP-binding protein [Prolixibacteraceae bacterium]
MSFNTENEMLMHNSVETVVRDSFGYIWVGTNYGLNRLDGHKTINYLSDPTNPNSISNSHVKELFVDSKGRLWIGTVSGGLNRFNYSNNTFIQYSPYDSIISKAGLNVPAITEDLEGNIWIGTVGKGVSKFYPDSGVFQNFDLELFDPLIQENTNISNLHCDKKGNIWVGFDFDRNGIYKIDGKTYEITFHGLTTETTDYLNVGAVTGIAEQKDGTLLFTIWNSQIFKLNPEVDERIKLVLEKNIFNNSHLTSIVIDEDDNIWISTWENGLYKFSPDFKEVQQYCKNDFDLSSLSSNSINDLYIDENNLWICLREQGLNLLSLNNKIFSKVNTLQVSAFKEIDAHCFTTDKVGNIWIGSRGQGLWKYSPSNGSLKNYNKPNYKSLLNNNILSIKYSNDSMLWIGTDGDFIAAFNTKKEEFKFVPHHEGDWSSVYCIEETEDYLWCGTWGAGLKKVDKKTLSYTSINFDVKDQYRNSIFDIDIVEDDIWMANVGMGLINYNIPNNQINYIYQYPNLSGKFPKESLNDIYIENPSSFWLSTAGGGLLNYNPNTYKIETTTTDNGLSSNVIQAIAIDNNKNLWISTNTGINLYNREKNEIATFYKHNGLIINHLNKSALLFSPIDNQLYIGSPKGINTCNTNKVELNQNTNPVVLTQLAVNEKNITIKDSDVLNQPIELAKKIKLKHDQKIINIGFSSMEFNPSSKSKYYYKLEGFKDNWTELAHSSNHVQYTNLDPGNYTFKVKASNNDGIFHPIETALKITVKPSFWQTILFKVLLVLIILIIAALFFYLRYKTLIKNQLKLEETVQERTIEINKQKEHIEQQKSALELANQTKDKFFTLISHDLKNPISIIDQFHELLLLEHESISKETTLKYYQLLKKTSNQTLQLLDDLSMWAQTQSKRITINKKHIDVAKLIKTNFTICESIASNKNIKLQQTKNIYQTVNADESTSLTIIRNLITNAIKFSNENSTINVNAIANDKYITICIEDSGIGMSQKVKENLFITDKIISREGTLGEKGSGIGLVLCKEFVNLNGGEIWVESEENKGSTFYFTLEKA